RRPAAADETKGEEVGSVPATVQVDRGFVYQLALAPEATDADLAGLPALAQVMPLHGLVLRGCTGLTEECLAHLQELSDLRELATGGGQEQPNLWLTDAAIANLEGLAGLERLSLSACCRLTNAGLAWVGYLTALRELSVSGCGQVTGAGLTALRSLESLRKL